VSDPTSSALDELHSRAEDLDRDDPLARWRDEFIVAEPDLVYLDGNSLGMAPRRSIDAVNETMRGDWAAGLIRSWDHWVDLPMVVGDELAPLIGASTGEVVVHDSVSVNLYQLLHAALRLVPDRDLIAISRDDFPTDRYIAAGVAEATGAAVHTDLDPDTIDIDRLAVMVRSVVDYRTAALDDLVAETARARDLGALVIWDLSHAAGVLPVDLNGAGAQLAVGCTYKFLNAGPGGPGFSYVARELHEQLHQPIRGWWSQESMFDMADTYRPRPDIGRLMIGTPGILGLVAARSGIGLTAEVGIDAIAAKAAALVGFGLDCCDALGLESPTPRDPERRGGHLSVRHRDARAINDALLREHRVLADFRQPDLIRLGCSPLTTRYRDVLTGCAAIAAQTAA
jgi:kynureninase